ncbi:polysaccharide biosynthesis protein [Thermanaerovibrio velox]|nr:nucleoside-diphosphate sugar epimerase/dehydratase [Thermanaerovibrio velox]
MDLVIGLAASAAAFAIRLGLPIPHPFAGSLLPYLLISLALKTGLEVLFGLWRQSWRNSSTQDLLCIVRFSVTFTVLSSAASFLAGPSNMPLPRGIPLIDGALSLIFLGGARMLVRIRNEKNHHGDGTRPVLIVGAGSAGVSMAKEIQRNPQSRMTVAAFLDDDPRKQGLTFAGVPVVGTLDQLPQSVRKVGAQEVLIAIPSAPGSLIRRVFEAARQAKVKARTVPSLEEILSGKLSIDYIRDVQVEDLLRREPVKLDLEEIGRYLTGRTVLITGAGGSIGSELVRQVMRFNPGHMVLLGRGENSLYLLERELRRFNDAPSFQTLVADVRQMPRIRSIFREFKPSVVFHAAAHKHVPMMEQSPEEAVLNNLLGTRNVADACLEFQTDVLVNISTDKAVNPTSVMGASKRLAEMVVRSRAMSAGEGKSFVSVRFGNVLGSRGSVIPLFKEQIRNGGPVTVTDPNMIRYFMTIPEAAQLVLQAGGMMLNGAVFVLDMGEPVRILDMAKDLIRLSGFEPGRDIEIRFTGARPGEKLYEELLTSEEDTEATRHNKIFIARGCDVPDHLDDAVDRLAALAEEGDRIAIRRMMAELIPNCTVAN